jgi:hypothetical protein
MTRGRQSRGQGSIEMKREMDYHFISCGNVRSNNPSEAGESTLAGIRFSPDPD